jgi:hypothetical protein
LRRLVLIAGLLGIGLVVMAHWALLSATGYGSPVWPEHLLILIAAILSMPTLAAVMALHVALSLTPVTSTFEP